MAKLTEAQRRVLVAIGHDLFTVRGRGDIAADRPELPYTHGLRAAFDELAARRLIEPVTIWRATDAGRSALAEQQE